MNGTPITESVYGSGAGTQQNTGMVIVDLPASASLELINHSSAAAVTLATVIGGTVANINASVLIQKLN
jgi:hypothetical protein